MDNEKQLKELFEKLLKSEGGVEVSNNDVPNPDPSFLKEIMKQRREQRDGIYSLAILLTKCSFMFLVGLYVAQALGRIIVAQDFNILQGYELEIFTAAVFVEIIGIIGIIAKAIWDDRNYKNMIYKDYRDKNQRSD